MGWRDERLDVEDIFWEDDKPTKKEAEIGKAILDTIKRHQGTWNWKENPDDFILEFTAADIAKQAAHELSAMQTSDTTLFWSILPNHDETRFRLTVNDSGLASFLTNHLLPPIEREYDLIEQLYKAATAEGKWDKWEGEPRIKLKFKDKTARNKAAKTLRELLRDRPFSVHTDKRTTYCISSKSLAIEPLTHHIGKAVYSFFLSRDRQDFIDERKDAHRRSAAFENLVNDMFKKHGIEMKPRVKVKGDYWDELYKIASKEVDMFTTFSATVSDTDMEERFVSLRREGEHRRSIELDAAALVANTAIIGELKTMPNEKYSVWAWYAHGYASAIHKYVLASGFSLKHAYEQIPPFVIPVMVVNREVKPEELKERTISPALISALNLPGYKGTPRKLATTCFTEIIDLIIERLRHIDQNEPVPREANRMRAFVMARAHFSRDYVSPTLTVEELDLLVQAVKQDPPTYAKSYTINGKEVRAHTTKQYCGGLSVRSPWPERQLTLQQFLILQKTLLTQEGRDQAVLRAYRCNLVRPEQGTELAQLQLFAEPQTIEDLVIDTAKRNEGVRNELIQDFLKKEDISMLLTIGAYIGAYNVISERAASAFTEEQKQREYAKFAAYSLPLFDKIVELLGKDGKAELVPKLKQAREQHKDDPVILGIELCNALGDEHGAQHLARRHKRVETLNVLDGRGLRPNLHELEQKLPPDQFKEFVEGLYHSYVAQDRIQDAIDCCEYLPGKEWLERKLKHLLPSQGMELTDKWIVDALRRLYEVQRLDYLPDCEPFKKLCESDKLEEIEIAAIVCGQNSADPSLHEKSKALWTKALAIAEERGDHYSLKHAAWIANNRLHDKKKYVNLCERAGLERQLADHWEAEGKLDKALDYWRHRDKRKVAHLYERMGELEEALTFYQERADTRDIIRVAYALGRHDLIKDELHVVKARLETQGADGLARVALLEEMFGDWQKAFSIYEKLGIHTPLFDLALEYGDRARAEQEFIPSLQEHETSGDFGYCAYLCRRIGDEERGRVYQALATSFKHLEKVAEMRASFKTTIEEQRTQAAAYRANGDLDKANEFEELAKSNEEKAAHNERVFAKRYRNRGLDAEEGEEEE